MLFATIVPTFLVHRTPPDRRHFSPRRLSGPPRDPYSARSRPFLLGVRIMYRFRLVVLAVACVAVTGCVEGEVTYTVNPDGTAKVKFDVVTVKPVQLTFGPPNAPGAK